MLALRHVRRNLVAYLALFVALGGTAYAARPLLTGADIQDGTVASIDIKDADLTATDVAPNALTGAVINESTLTGVDAATLDGHDSADFALAGTGPNAVAASHNWTPIILSQANPVIIGDPLVVGDWTVTPTCSPGNLSIAITGPDGYTKTLTRSGTFVSAQQETLAFPELTQTPVSSTLLMSLEWATLSLQVAAACSIRVVGLQAEES
jgi:hypothetical protein